MDTELYEIWAWFVLGIIILLTRYAVRIRTVGFKGFQGDDYMTIGTVLFYTMDAAVVTIVYYTGQNVDVTPDMVDTLTKADIARLTYGSKLELTAWYSYTSLIWCMKFTMLFFYKRLTLGSLHSTMVRYLFWITGTTYLAVFLTVSLGCHPIHLNWQVVPIPPWKCSFRPQNFIVVAVLNILTDAALLSIPIPMLWQLKIPIRKKFVIGLILSSGLFVIIAAIVRVVYSLDAEPSAGNINRWGVRETIIGIFAINIPILRPLFSRSFWTWGPYDPSAPSTRPSANSKSGASIWSQWKGKRLSESDPSGASKDIEMGNRTGKSSISRSASQEMIVGGKDNIIVHTTYDIESHDRGDGGSTRRQSWGNLARVVH